MPAINYHKVPQSVKKAAYIPFYPFYRVLLRAIADILLTVVHAILHFVES